jgi:hypothetical protein
LTGRKILGCYLLMAFSVMAVVAFLVEVTSYLVLVVMENNFYLPLDLRRVHTKEIQEKTEEIFSHELGWEPAYATSRLGYRGQDKDLTNAFIALFGDSFTEGYREIEKSWPFLLEQKLGRPVLNFGVSGYGTDQAFWRFQKYYEGKIATPFVAICIMSENIARVVNRYRGFYRRRKDLSLTKPMYVESEAGGMVLLPNPLKSAEDIEQLSDMEFLREMGQTDYWFSHFARHDLNHLVHFPYSYFFVKALPYCVMGYYQKRICNDSDYKALYQNERALSVMNYVISRFIQSVKEQGAQPIVLFLPCWKDFVDHDDGGRTVYDGFLRSVKTKHDATLDAMTYFTAKRKQGEAISSFFVSPSDGHYNAHGEEVLSEGFYGSLRHLATVDGTPFPDGAPQEAVKRGPEEVEDKERIE